MKCRQMVSCTKDAYTMRGQIGNAKSKNTVNAKNQDLLHILFNKGHKTGWLDDGTKTT